MATFDYPIITCHSTPIVASGSAPADEWFKTNDFRPIETNAGYGYLHPVGPWHEPTYYGDAGILPEPSWDDRDLAAFERVYTDEEMDRLSRGRHHGRG